MYPVILPDGAAEYFAELRPYLVAQAEGYPGKMDLPVDGMIEGLAYWYESNQEIEQLDIELAIMRSPAPIADRCARLCARAQERFAANRASKARGIQ